jgi:hypothetical protein
LAEAHRTKGFEWDRECPISREGIGAMDILAPHPPRFYVTTAIELLPRICWALSHCAHSTEVRLVLGYLAQAQSTAPVATLCGTVELRSRWAPSCGSLTLRGFASSRGSHDLDYDTHIKAEAPREPCHTRRRTDHCHCHHHGLAATATKFEGGQEGC